MGKPRSFCCVLVMYHATRAVAAVSKNAQSMMGMRLLCNPLRGTPKMFWYVHRRMVMF